MDPCIHLVYAWALKYLNRDYIKAQIYTNMSTCTLRVRGHHLLIRSVGGFRETLKLAPKPSNAVAGGAVGCVGVCSCFKFASSCTR